MVEIRMDPESEETQLANNQYTQRGLDEQMSSANKDEQMSSAYKDADTFSEISDPTLKYQVEIVTNIYLNIMARETDPDWNQLEDQLNAIGYKFNQEDLTQYTHYFHPPAFGAESPKPPSAQETAAATPNIMISTGMKQTKVAPILIPGEQKQREQAACRILSDDATLIFLTSKKDIAEQDKNEKEWTELLSKMQQEDTEESKEPPQQNDQKKQILDFIKLYDMEIKGLILAKVLTKTLFLHIDSWQLAYYIQLASDYGSQETNQFKWALGEVQELHNKLQQSPNLANDLLSCLKNHHMQCEGQFVNDLSNFDEQTSKFHKDFKRDAFFAYMGFGKSHILNETPWLTQQLRQRREQFLQRPALIMDSKKLHPADKWVSTDTQICIKLPPKVVKTIWKEAYEMIPTKMLNNIHVWIPIQRIDSTMAPLMNSKEDYFMPVVIDDEYSVQEQYWLKKVFDVAELQTDFKSQKPGIVIHVDHHALNSSWSSCIMLHEYQTRFFKRQFDSAANRGGRRRTDSSYYPTQDNHSNALTTPESDNDEAVKMGPWSTEKQDGILGNCSELNGKNRTQEDLIALMSSHEEVALKCYAYYEEKVGHAFTEFAQMYLQIRQVVECIYDDNGQNSRYKDSSIHLLTLNLIKRSNNNRETIQQLQIHLDTLIDQPEQADPQLSAAKLFRVSLGPAEDEPAMIDTNICVPQALHTMVGQRLYKTLGHLLMVGARTDRYGALCQLIKLASLHSIKVPLSTAAKGDKPWLTFCDESARLRECFLVLKETWSIKTILTVTADDLAFNWRLSSAVQTRTCLLLLVNQPWKGGQRNMITNHALSMKFYRGHKGLQWYYSEHGEKYKPTIQQDRQQTPICLQLFQDVFSVQIYQTTEREGLENQAYHNADLHKKQAIHQQSKSLAERIMQSMNTNPLGTQQQSVAPQPLNITDKMDNQKVSLEKKLDRMEKKITRSPSGSNEEPNQTEELKKALLAVIHMLSIQPPEYSEQQKETSLQILEVFGDVLTSYTFQLMEGKLDLDVQLLWCSLIVNDLIEDGGKQSPSWANFEVINPVPQSVECNPKSFLKLDSLLDFENESQRANCEQVQKALEDYDVHQDRQREEERLSDAIATRKTTAENLANSSSPGECEEYKPLGLDDENLVQLLKSKNFIIKALRQDHKNCFRAIAFGCVGDDKKWSLFKKAIILYMQKQEKQDEWAHLVPQDLTQDEVVRLMLTNSDQLDNNELENYIFVLSAPMFKIKVYRLSEARNTLEHTTYPMPLNSHEADDEEEQEDQKISVLNFCRHPNGYYSYLQTNGANKGLATIKHRNQMARRNRRQSIDFGHLIVQQPTLKVRDRVQYGQYAPKCSRTSASNSGGPHEMFTTVRYSRDHNMQIYDAGFIAKFQSNKGALDNVMLGLNQNPQISKSLFSRQRSIPPVTRQSNPIITDLQPPRARSVPNQQKTRAKKPKTKTNTKKKRKSRKKRTAKGSPSSNSTSSVKAARVKDYKKQSSGSSTNSCQQNQLDQLLEAEIIQAGIDRASNTQVQPEVQPEVRLEVQLEVPQFASDQGIGANSEAEKSNDTKNADKLNLQDSD